MEKFLHPAAGDIGAHVSESALGGVAAGAATTFASEGIRLLTSISEAQSTAPPPVSSSGSV